MAQAPDPQPHSAGTRRGPDDHRDGGGRNLGAAPAPGNGAGAEDADGERRERELIDRRRESAGVDPQLPRAGLALSGGGVRSATFCFGALRALAANNVLQRFDYLSTVSGGGYIGALLGRLFGPGAAADVVARGLASDRSLLLWWLRANGRYLIPSGLADLLQAGASQLRGVIATQFEAAVVALLVAALVVLPHVLVQVLGWVGAAGQWLQFLPTLWWAALPLPAYAGAIAIFAYWFSRDADDTGARDAGVAAVAALVAFWLGWRVFAVEFEPSVSLALLVAVAALLACVPIAWLVRLAHARKMGPDGTRQTPAAARVVYTRWLARSLAGFLAVLALGFADLASWLAAWLWLYVDGLDLSTGTGLVALAVIAARAVLPVLQQWQRAGGQLAFDRLANVAGLLLVALVVLIWLTLLQALVFLAEASPAMQTLLHQWSAVPGARWLVAVGLLVLYAAATRWNLTQLNRSSMHEFYRSRLARTYVSVGNHGRRGGPRPRFAASPLDDQSRDLTDRTRRVTELLAGDDVALNEYQPHAYGGPLHLINCCINQTRDDRTGGYNADRKGIALTVSALGCETGTQRPTPALQLQNMPLASWIAISGAAASSGMGSLTRPGTAALLFLSGLRLGYWWQHAAGGRFGKYRGLLSELFARFPGLRSAAWYLSDGGHFDNTGVYALLKRRLPLIVLADCGADPRYLFGDLESLVRKARLDYAAQIDVLDPTALPATLSPLFGTPETIGPDAGLAHLVLARIRYHDGTLGALLVVKPRRLPDLPLDVAGYADRAPAFPQQTTGDQFFDEAQWESYHALGRLLGAALTPALLDALPALVATTPAARIGSVTAAPVAAPPSRRARLAATVGTSLGIGAIASMALAGWQLWEQNQRAAAEHQRAFLDASAKTVETIVDADAAFTSRVRLQIDALLSLAAAAPGAGRGQERTLAMVADALAPACAGTGGADCAGYLQALRGESVEETVLQKAVARYWAEPPPALDRVAALKSRLLEFMTIRDLYHALRPEPPTASAPPPPPPPSVAAPGPGPGEPLSVPAAPQAACVGAKPTGISLYIHIYSETERAEAAAIARVAVDDWGVAVPAIRNVSRSAERANLAAPTRWRRATWLYRGEEGRRCAEAASQWLTAAAAAELRRESKAVALPATLRATPGVVELWLPPRQ